MLDMGLDHRKSLYCPALLFESRAGNSRFASTQPLGRIPFHPYPSWQNFAYPHRSVRNLALNAVFNGLNIKYLINLFINQIYSL